MWNDLVNCFKKCPYFWNKKTMQFFSYFLLPTYSYDPKEHVAQMNIEGWQFQRIFKHIGQKCSKWTYRVLLSLRYWQVMFNKNPFLLLKWSKNSKIILNPVIIAVLKSLFPCFLIYIFCNFENLINVQALTSHIGGAKSLKKNKRACMFFWVMRALICQTHIFLGKY